MAVIEDFIQYLSPYDPQDQDTFNQFFRTPQYARTVVLPELITKQNTLFKKIGIMTEKMLHECFEPCMRAALVNAFHLQGIDQGAQRPPESVTGAGFVADPGTQRNGHTCEQGKTTTTLLRTFQSAQEFTKFVRALIFITNEGQPQAFHPARGVIRSSLISVDSHDPDPRRGRTGGNLKAPLKASVRFPEEGEQVDNSAAYTFGNKRYLVIENPVLASFYFG